MPILGPEFDISFQLLILGITVDSYAAVRKRYRQLPYTSCPHVPPVVTNILHHGCYYRKDTLTLIHSIHYIHQLYMHSLVLFT